MADQAGRCPKCGSGEVIRGVQVMTAMTTAGAERIGEVVAEVDRHPRAVFLKGPISSPLKAFVCGHCGFTELYVDQPGELLAAYRVGQPEAGSR